MAEKVFVSVTNNLVTDQRAHRVCKTLKEMGFDVVLIGRMFPDEPMGGDRNYHTKRFKLLFNKGFLFYKEYNLRLFFYLLFNRVNVFLANDADTLPANFLASKIKGKPLVVDCHEYFTEVPELKDRKYVKRFWLSIEKYILPKADSLYTVSSFVSKAYRELCGVNMKLVRNVPLLNKTGKKGEDLPLLKRKEGENLILYQGAVNKGRGVEIAIKAVAAMDNSRLLIVGEGDLYHELKNLVHQKNWGDKIEFMGKVPFEQLHSITKQADIGLSIEDLSNPSYKWALPNKFFDYLVAGVPVIITPHFETKKIVEQFNVGRILNDRTPDKLAQLIEELLKELKTSGEIKENCKRASEEFNWEKEQEKLKKIFRPFV